MELLLGILVLAIAIGAAVRMGRARGVPAPPLLAGSLFVAVVISALAGGGAWVAMRFGRGPAAQVLLVVAGIGAALAVGVWLSGIIWRRLQARHRPPGG
ncbi:MAG: hypothetical protein ACOZE5_13765 [Verrucomicrobiota bacterium]